LSPYFFEIRDQVARALAFGELQPDPADAVATRRALDAQGLQAAHPAFVPRAARFDALADPDFLLREHLVELALMHCLGFERFRLLLLVGGEVARVSAQVSAVELDDPQRDRIEEAPVMGDDQHAAGKRKQRLLQPFDRGEIEMVGRLVEEEQIGRHDKRARQRHALLQPAREIRYRIVLGQLQAAERGLDPVLEAPAVARIERFLQMLHPLHQRDVVFGGVMSMRSQRVRRGVIIDQQFRPLAQSFGHRLEHALPGPERGLLRNARQLQLRRAPDLAVIGRGKALDDIQEAGFAGAVAADQADALAGLDDEIDTIEQRHMAVSQGYL